MKPCASSRRALFQTKILIFVCAMAEKAGKDDEVTFLTLSLAFRIVVRPN